MVDVLLIEAMRDDPEIAGYIEGLTEEESKEDARNLIREQARLQGISEMAFIGRMIPIWLETREKSRQIWPALARHLTNALKVCD